MSLDTSADAAAVRLRALRSMSGSERLAHALDMSETVRALWERGRRDRADRASIGEERTELHRGPTARDADEARRRDRR